MSIGFAIVVIAAGAILRYAVATSVAGVDLQTLGLILMIAGAGGLVIALFLAASNRTHIGTDTAQPFRW